ncbi:MAG: glycine cleavage system aminomethyltransferase GcvT [Actinomycetota bacterium]|nr:glycine cleavage system aminomethyltransferase GcvT [Actinomycetota bacterium]
MPRSPLHALHQQLGARFVDFGGWEMPVQYEGVLAEHLAVRKAVGVFDVSHLGRFRVHGEGSTELLRRLLCNDAGHLEAGQAQYTMLLNAEGGVEDDIIVWRWDDDEYWVLPNGVNYGKVLGTFQRHGSGRLEVKGLQDRTSFLAVQGPEAPDLIERVVGWRPRRFRVARAEFRGASLWVAGTGYTGEAGGELAIGAADAAGLLEALIAEGARPCGLGARDTLRLEMGYPLWGKDLDASTSPLEAGQEWVVDWDHEFIGKPALERQRLQGLPSSRLGLVMEGKEIPRHGHPVRADGASGQVASGNYSPTLQRGIGLAYLSPPPEGVERLEVQVRSRWVAARPATPPFIDKGR